jgi:hypothetical protein
MLCRTSHSVSLNLSRKGNFVVKPTRSNRMSTLRQWGLPVGSYLRLYIQRSELVETMLP